MMRYLIEAPTPALIELAGGQICVTHRNVWDVDGFRKWLAWSRHFLELWPGQLAAEPKVLPA